MKNQKSLKRKASSASIDRFLIKKPKFDSHVVENSDSSSDQRTSDSSSDRHASDSSSDQRTSDSSSDRHASDSSSDQHTSDSSSDQRNHHASTINTAQQARLDSELVKMKTSQAVSTLMTSKTSAPSPSRQKTKKQESNSNQRKFQEYWKEDFPWVEYSQSDDSMFCILCRESRQETVMGTTGTRSFKVKTLIEHARGRQHRLALAAAEATQKLIAHTLRKEQQERKEAVIVALKAVHWLSEEELANHKYSSLMSLLRNYTVPGALYLYKSGNVKYTSPDIFNQLLDCINQVHMKQLKQDLRNSPFVGIGVDESTDRAQEKHVAVIIRYIMKPTAKVKTTFLACKPVADGTSRSVLNAVKEALHDFGIPIRKVTGLGTDGAAAMASDMNGLNGLVQKENPFTVHVHCVCHRLNLAVSQACKDIPLVQVVTSVLGQVYLWIQTSPNRLQKFKDIAAIFELDAIKMRRLFEIRWLSLGESVTALIRNYEALMILADDEAAMGDSVAHSVLSQLSSYKIVAMLHLLADVLGTSNHLSKIFQYRDVCFSSIKSKLQDCLETLDTLRTDDGPYMNILHNAVSDGQYKGISLNYAPARGDRRNQREIFTAARGQLIDNLRRNLERRFPRIDLLHAMQIFDPHSYPEEAHELVAWGLGHLETLLLFYAVPKERVPPLVEPDTCRGEFLPFKRLIHRNRFSEQEADDDHYLRPVPLLERIFGGRNLENRRIFPGMFRLMSVAVCIMVGNAEAERVFSCQNRIKSKLRTRLSIEHLDQLIRVSYSDVNRDEFNYEQAADLFLNMSLRRI